MVSFKPAVNSNDRVLIEAALKVAKRRKVKLYLVGGYLRDILLGREKENPDIDFALKKGAINFARESAKELRCGFVALDKEHGCGRAVKKLDGKIYTLDFTDFRGKDLEGDLLHRDFTINALALEADKLFAGPIEDNIIDPHSGRRDLKKKLVRMVNKKAFDEDPLRILRAFSAAVSFGFKIDKDTLKAVKAKARKLSVVSFERIRDELFKILQAPGAFEYVNKLDDLKILKIIIPEIEPMRGKRQGPYHHLDIWKHTLETLRQLEIVFEEFKKRQEVNEYLDEIISPTRTRRALMKLGALLHDIGKPKAMRREGRKLIFHGHERVGLNITKYIVERLKLSNDEMDSLGKMVLWHLRPGYLGDTEEPTARAIFRYFRDAGKESVSTLILSLADQRATKGPLTTKKSRVQHEHVCQELIRRYFKKQKEKKPARLINGDDIMKKFRLQPSPLIGKILREVEELQAIGKIKTIQEALKAASKFI
ncbi:MAG: HD domain-containing protein [Candidatus Omnitrophota bacterium]|jgi:poly(A) polymerase